ncbi:peptidoglycan editing factor PgeF [Alteraurantiacibacter buctensis]|uniref:Purine nucleoside phosphorylase n=1 Tax=Alteraurantiacibacter buctensis TaxID=1503981 RepID=A0A844YUB0_9SPHN|nr:peptidoglycan editing factor PgeF [Alteraurantiacibacter buctensis]MXO70610.1 peptidoglycan editing factor PgeF [Alteraurantiacibacter buctensis]
MGGEVIRSAALDGVAHGFLDAAQSDAEAFDLVPHRAGPVFLKQVHSALAVTVSEPFAGDPPEADALVTATPGLALAIRTADCAPVLLADTTAGVIGAAHAGWRGAVGGVLEATVAAMVALGASPASIVAVVGPTIARPSYEVDEGFHARLLHGAPENARFFTPGRTGHWQFDLPAYVVARLGEAGVGQVEDLALDTYAGAGRFHSFRRATHRAEPTYGRQFALISL